MLTAHNGPTHPRPIDSREASYLSLGRADVDAGDGDEDGDLEVVRLLLHGEQPLPHELGPPRRVRRLHRKRPQVLKKREKAIEIQCTQMTSI